MHVEPSVFDSYYNGCCNGTFWPLFHSMPDRATFIAEHWRAYSAVNEEFAAKTVSMISIQIANRTEQSVIRKRKEKEKEIIQFETM